MSGNTEVSVGLVVRDDLEKARAELLEGRGPGASPEEVTANGRNNAIQGGVPVELRLVHTAQATARARGDDSTLTDALTAEAAAGFGTSDGEEEPGVDAGLGRLSPGDPDHGGGGLARSTAVIAVVAALVIGLLARRYRIERRGSGARR